MARPSIYAQERAATIFARIEAGEPLTQVCREDGMPALRTVLRSADEDETFRDAYARARDAQAEHLDAEIQPVSETAVDKDTGAAAAGPEAEGTAPLASARAAQPQLLQPGRAA